MPEADPEPILWPEGTVLVVDRQGVLCTGTDPVAVGNLSLSSGLIDVPLVSATPALNDYANAGRARYAGHPERYPTPVDRTVEEHDRRDFRRTVDAATRATGPGQFTTNYPFVVLPGPDGFQAHIHTAHSYPLDAADLALLAQGIDQVLALAPSGPGHGVVPNNGTTRGLADNGLGVDGTESTTEARARRLWELGFLLDAPTCTERVEIEPLNGFPVGVRSAGIADLPADVLPVLSVATQSAELPVALAYVHAALKDNDTLRGLIAPMIIEADQVTPLLKELRDRSAVWAFSSYRWTVDINSDLAAAIKRVAPQHVILHGGPAISRNDDDLAAYLDAHRNVDVAVIGEGEITTTEVISRIVRTATDPHTWASMPPGSARLTATGTLLKGADRERISSLAHIPSPYLSGALDRYSHAVDRMAVVETNRGCPYNCTLCDRQPTTKSRIRTHPLERVFKELDWVAEHHFATLVLAEAHFGVLPRDVAIADHLAELKRTTGYPKNFITNYSKNPNPRLLGIMEMLREAGIFSLGTIDVPTVDEETNNLTRRSNIGFPKYQRLNEALNESGVPLATDLQIGLPAGTISAWPDDLQFLVDTEIRADADRCHIHPNGPMSDPGYQRAWGIKTDDHGLVYETGAASRTDIRQMLTELAAIYGADGLGWFRLPLRKMAQQKNEREIDLICELQTWVLERRAEFPLSAFLLTAGTRWAISPAPWPVVFAELRTAAEACWGAQHWAAWQSVVAAQQAILPERGATFPQDILLNHDVVRWWNGVSEAKRRFPGAWRQHALRLALMPEGRLHIDESSDIVDGAFAEVTSLMLGARWDLNTPLSRTVVLPRVRA